MRFRRRRFVLVALLTLTLLANLPGIALAGDDESEETPATPPPPPVTEVTSVLPVLGSGLTVSLTRDDAGTITQVALDPSGATTVKEGDHKVVFLLADGDTQVVVKSFSKDKGDDGDERAAGVKTTVTADATADVTGDGSWSADVFGTGVVTIPYTVSWDGNSPTITIGDIVLPAGVTAEIGEPKIKVTEEKSRYKISVKLSNGEDDAKVAFHASSRLDDDGELKVKLAVTLDAKSHVRCWDDDRRDRDDRDDDDRDRGDDDDEVAAASESGDRWDDDDDRDRGRGDEDDDDRGRGDDDDDDHGGDNDDDD